MSVDNELRAASEAIRAARRRSELAMRPPAIRNRASGPILAGLTAAVVLLLGTPFLFRSVETNQSLVAAPNTPVTTQVTHSGGVPTTEGFPFITLATDSWRPVETLSLIDVDSGEVVAIQAEYTSPELGVWLVVISGAFEDSQGLRGGLNDAFIQRFASLPLVVASAELLATADREDAVSANGFDGTLYFIGNDQSAEITGESSDIYALKWDPIPGYEAMLVGPSDSTTLLELATQSRSVALETWTKLAASASQTTTTVGPGG